MNASVQMKLLKAHSHPEFTKIFHEFNIHGKPIDDQVYEISNRRKLGLSEVKSVQDIYDGVKKLLEVENNECRENSNL